MKLNELLFENPQLIDPIDSKKFVNDLDHNHKLYDDLVMHSHQLIKQINDHIILVRIDAKRGKDFNFQYVGLDNKNEQVCFLSRCVVKTDKILGRYVFQNFLWVSPRHKKEFHGWPSKLVFEQLLPKYGTITTDEFHTPKGMNYWAKLVKQTHTEQDGTFNVYHFNKKQEQIHLVKSVHHLIDLQKEHKIWDHGPNGAHQLVVITTKKLHQKKHSG